MTRTHTEQTARTAASEGRCALFVTTLPVTLTAFLLPHADALRQQGWTVDCLTAPPGSGGAGTPADEVVIAGHFDQRHSVGWSRSVARSLLAYPDIARSIRSIVADGRYDIVHVHTPGAAFITRAALRGVRQRLSPAAGASCPLVTTATPRLIYTVHGFHFMDGQTGAAPMLYRFAERQAAYWTDDLVVMNDQDERAAGVLAAGTGCRVHRIDGVGIDLESYRQPPSASQVSVATNLCGDLGISPDDFVVASIGELNRNKRPDLLVRAAHILRGTIPELRVIVAGDGPMRSALEDEISLLGLGDVVTLLGHVSRDTLRVITERADIGMLVSEREGLPRSLMEFVAAGTPIAGTRTRGITDEVIDERALADGAAVSGEGGREPVGDRSEYTPGPADVAAVIERLWADEGLRVELHAAQYARAAERYDLPVVLEQYRALYAV